MTTSLDQAMKLADQDCPLPSLAGPALKALRARVLELEGQQAAPVGVPNGMALVPREMVAEAVQVLRNVDTQLRATGQRSARIERAINALSPLATAPSAPQANA